MLTPEKKREVINYLIFGVLTTVVSFLTYLAFTRIFKLEVVSSNVISWIVSVTFAYVTNRIWVFHSKKKGVVPITKEVVRFYASRVFSGLVETSILYVAVDLMQMYDIPVKIVATGIVVVLNYILSKVIVFKKPTTTP